MNIYMDYFHGFIWVYIGIIAFLSLKSKACAQGALFSSQVQRVHFTPNGWNVRLLFAELKLDQNIRAGKVEFMASNTQTTTNTLKILLFHLQSSKIKTVTATMKCNSAMWCIDLVNAASAHLHE